MRLNLGCGEFYAPDWCNLDTYDGNPVDLVADMQHLPLDDASVERVYAGHVLEHVSAPEGVIESLYEIHRVLEPGGTLLIVGPDVRRGRRMLEAGQIDEAQYDVILNSSGRWPGDVHLWPCHEQRLVELTYKVFPVTMPVPIAQVGSGWPVVSHVGWQCAVLAVKETS